MENKIEKSNSPFNKTILFSRVHKYLWRTFERLAVGGRRRRYKQQPKKHYKDDRIHRDRVGQGGRETKTRFLLLSKEEASYCPSSVSFDEHDTSNHNDTIIERWDSIKITQREWRPARKNNEKNSKYRHSLKSWYSATAILWKGASNQKMINRDFCVLGLCYKQYLASVKCWWSSAKWVREVIPVTFLHSSMKINQKQHEGWRTNRRAARTSVDSLAFATSTRLANVFNFKKRKRMMTSRKSPQPERNPKNESMNINNVFCFLFSDKIDIFICYEKLDCS